MRPILAILLPLSLGLAACATDKHAYTTNPQAIYKTMAEKYPSGKNTLIFVNAPEGFIAPRLANCAVEKDVNTGKVAAIASALALKTSKVFVAGQNEALTATTVQKALAMGTKEQLDGAQLVVIGSKETVLAISTAAAASGVTIEFIDNPN